LKLDFKCVISDDAYFHV